MKRPLFSCVLPVKGPRPFMDEALASLRAQGMGDDLEIIVQDGDVESDAGQSDALNKGFAKAHGEWLFWLNADDVLLPGALATVARVIRDWSARALPVKWIVGNELFIDADGKRVGASVGMGWHDGLYRHAVPHVNGPSAFFRRDLLERVGGFDPSLRYCMDWDLWIRFAQAGAKFVRIDDFLWAQRRWPGSKTQREKTRAEDLVHQNEVRRMLKKNAFVVTRTSVWRVRFWRLLTGCYLCAWWNSWGKCPARPRAAILVMHRAPYRDPVLDSLVQQGLVDVFSVFDHDKGHAWAGFRNDVPSLSGRGLVVRLLSRFVLSRHYRTVVWPAYHPWWLTLPIAVSAILGRRYGLTSDTKEENGGRFAQTLKRYIHRRAAFVWVPGNAARIFLSERYGVSKGRIADGLFLVDPKEVCATCSKRTEAVCKNFLMVANDIPGRRMDVLVEGFRRWRREKERADVRLVLCGRNCGKYAGDGVVGLDGVPWHDMLRLYDEADVYVHNGKEQYSTAVQIATLRGLPLICSKGVGIVADFPDPPRTMVVVENWQSAASWHRAFEGLAGMPLHVRQEMCAHLRQEALARFDVRRVAEEISRRISGKD